jgi:Tripartite tricarboxylate transporter family receptor
MIGFELWWALICCRNRYCGSQVLRENDEHIEGGSMAFTRRKALVAWQGVVAPAGTPLPIVDALAAQIAKLLADPATRERFAAIALEPLPGSTPDSFSAHIKSEIDRWAAIVKNSGAELE